MEDLQAKCLQIILGQKSKSYERNLATLDLPTLEERRVFLIKQFAISTYKSAIHRWWYEPHPPPPLGTRIVVPRLKVPYTKKARGELCPFTHYSRVLNALSDEEWDKLEMCPPC